LTKRVVPGDGEAEVCRDPEQTFDATGILARLILRMPEQRTG